MTAPPVPPAAGEPSLRDKLLSGTLWMFSMRWLVRLLSIVSIVVLARLLDKDDFGLAAMASAVVALPTVLLELGTEQAVIRERQPERGHYNTAWTIRILQLSVVAACVYLIAPWMADFYNDARVTDILEVLAIAVFIRGLENFWTVSFRKNMDFRRDFTYEVMCKVFGVIFAIALAYALRSYWALIYGQVAAQSMRVLLSFVVAPRWPRPTLSHWRLIWAFSQWSLLSGFARFIVLHADKLILGRLATSEVVGAYALGREIAELPLSEITGPANRAFGPGFAEIQQERNRLAWALAKALGALATIAFPVALGLALTADELVFVMLGERWAATAPILEILAATTMFLVLRAVMGNTLVVLGFIRRLTIQGWIRAISYLAVAVPMTMSWGAIGLAAAFTVAELLAGLMMLHAYRRLLPELTLKLFVSGIARPGIGVAIMSACVLGVAHSGIAQIHLLLAGKVAAGVFSYTLVMYLLWRRAGRPDGLEAMALQRLRRWQPTK